MRYSRIGCTLVAALLFAAVTGCAAPRAEMSQQPEAFSRELAHGYTLLHQLSSKNKDVDKILIFKKVSDPSKALLKDIANHSGDVAKWIADTANSDKSIVIGPTGLPPVETAVRDAIESDKGMELLSAGKSFERDILLTQTEAMQYGKYLCKVLADVEKDDSRLAELKAYAEKFGELRERVAARLTVVDAADE